ncbi:glycogen synthase [Chlamydiifrater phoenicopteri]|uniref:glycogen synthase n=1 Tax=Chlamydiifrater phoenicopteri TaxID=2681469 RepID=UPI001BCDBB6D|nr:glycogen/starch synthase [Chlamydiifrater phoenicopteri]
MKIIHVSAEAAHFAKVGGLGDVVYDLADIFSLNHEVEIIIPFYEEVRKKNFTPFKKLSFDFFFNEKTNATATQIKKNRIFVTLLEASGYDFFNRNNIYGYPDDTERFACFCSAAAEYIYQQSLKKEVNVVHLHDWHSALIAGILKEKRDLENKLILTIHNFSHRGYSHSSTLRKTSISERNFKYYQLERDPDLCSFLKGGILCTQATTTVSPGYREEILQDVSDEEITNSLTHSKNTFYGILNGINTNYWNPETDPYIFQRYPVDPKKIKQTILGKNQNKKSLLKTLKLPQDSDPLICIISRLVHQKGLNFMLKAIEHAEKESYKIVVLGQCGDDLSKSLIETIQSETKYSNRIAIHLEHNEALAHQLYAGADIILIPSLFEPCGLTQLIGMRYGTLPLVRKTGGLGDTVKDFGNGFVFSETASTDEFLDKLRAVVKLYKHNQQVWQKIILEGISANHGWELSAISYLQIYRSLRDL